jgi:hypothetical protein
VATAGPKESQLAAKINPGLGSRPQSDERIGEGYVVPRLETVVGSRRLVGVLSVVYVFAMQFRLRPDDLSSRCGRCG